jgi:RNA polymerase sigma-70 factor (ECF subfamily)
VLAATVRVTRDLDAAEEAVQEAYVAALRTWGRDGIPDRPGAWLTTTARRRALNGLRRGRTQRSKLPLLVGPTEHDMELTDPDAIPDDRLRLVFTCCHPALAPEAQVALTLRLVCGVATPDVARALLVSETTMAARITRAKQKIAVARIPYAEPGPAERPARLDAVLTVVHLVHSTGHTAPSGPDLVRDDLAARALDLARMLHRLMPEEPEVTGLLALLLSHHARRATRTDAEGRIVRLADQDRSRWDRAVIAEVDRLVVAALEAGPPPGRPGRFTLQAAIASLHAQAPSYAGTDWAQVVVLYDRLRAVWPSPVVDLNRAVAVAEVDGAQVALALVDALVADGGLDRYPYLPATRAELLERLGRPAEALVEHRRALALTDNAAEQEHLRRRIAALEG